MRDGIQAFFKVTAVAQVIPKISQVVKAQQIQEFEINRKSQNLELWPNLPIPERSCGDFATAILNNFPQFAHCLPQHNTLKYELAERGSARS